MKKINRLTLLMLLSVLFFSTNAQAQDSIKIKKYNNEFGLDISGFVRQFFFTDATNLGSNYFYNPTYLLTYRRHIKKSNLRFAIGGSYEREDRQSSYPGDENKYEQLRYNFTARIGYEFFSNLSKKWQVFYGLDFRPVIETYKNDASYYNGGYRHAVKDTYITYGIAPLLGLRFKIINRLSLTTEASFTVNYQNSTETEKHIAVDPTNPPIDDIITKNKGKIFTNFSAPLSIIVTFDL